MEPGDEVSVDIERGKTLIVRFVALSEVRDDGTRQVFFELNGQPRSIVVTDRSQSPSGRRNARWNRATPGTSARRCRAPSPPSKPSSE